MFRQSFVNVAITFICGVNVISKRIGFNKSVLKHLFKKYILTRHDFLLVDSVRDDIRKNIYEIIPKEEYDNF